IRFSPNGDRIAFLDQRGPSDTGGSVAVSDLAGNKKTLTGFWGDVWGLAWAGSGNEIWFTAATAGFSHALYGVTLSGRQRLIAREAGNLLLDDISPDGRLLISHETFSQGISGLVPGQKQERDLSWFDGGFPDGLSADGKMLLFGEGGD